MHFVWLARLRCPLRLVRLGPARSLGLIIEIIVGLPAKLGPHTHPHQLSRKVSARSQSTGYPSTSELMT